MIGFFLRQVRGPLVLVLLIAAIGYGYFLTRLLPFWAEMQAAAGGAELQETLFYSAERAGAALGSYDAPLRRGALSFYALDIVFAGLFASALAGLMAYGLRRLHAEATPWRFALILPLASGGFDLLENALLAIALATNPAAPGLIGTIAGVATGLKLTLGMIAAPLTLLLLIAAGGRHAWRQLNPKSD